MSRHHTIITGTGRAGTTFLMQLLTALGLDTGFSGVTRAIDPNCNAGMEWDLGRDDAPYIVKSPWLCDRLDELLTEKDIIIDHAIVPVRDLFAAAESRRDVMRRSDSSLTPKEIPGGLWHTEEFDKQESVLTQQLYHLMQTLASRDIPLTLLYFPRLVLDPHYLYRKLTPVFGDIPLETWLSEFQSLAQPELIHKFSPG